MNIVKCLKKLNTNILNDVPCVSFGTLPKGLIAEIREKFPKLGARLSANSEVIFWKDRISHTERHRNDFASDALFDRCFEDIPQIIQRPDYINVREDKGSISFIKRYSQNVSVVVKVSFEGKLSYRTMYPLMSAQLEHYIEIGTAWRLTK